MPCMPVMWVTPGSPAETQLWDAASTTALDALPEVALASWGQGWGHSGSHHLLLLHGQAGSPFLGKHPAPLWQTGPHQCNP